MVSTTVQEIEDTLGAACPSPVPTEQWMLWISDAERIIARWARERGLTLADLDQGDLAFVVREAVADRVRFPGNVTQVDVAVDDGQVTKRYQSGTGQIAIRPEWWDLLTPDGQTNSTGAFNIRLAYESDAG